MASTTPEEKKKVLETVFNQFDKDGSGKIDGAELKDAIREFYQAQKETVDDAQIDADVGGILQLTDTSHDGKIDKNEWFSYFKV